MAALLCVHPRLMERYTLKSVIAYFHYQGLELCSIKMKSGNRMMCLQKATISRGVDRWGWTPETGKLILVGSVYESPARPW